MMVQSDFWRPEDLQSRDEELQRIVDVASRDRQTDFVKSLVSEKYLSARGKKSSGNCGHRSRHMPSAGRARLETAFVKAIMDLRAPPTKQNSSMLQRVIL